MRVREWLNGDDRGTLLIFGEAGDGCLVRIHSRCLYGDVLGSDDCDCGSELALALDMIQEEESGILVYLEQEGRGAGLTVKAQGLRHSQLFGVDTFASYVALDHGRDLRSFHAVAKVLVDLGLKSVRLLTNNPEKIDAVQAAGIAVERTPLITAARSGHARAYQDAKRRVQGHLFDSEVTHTTE
ncbi:Riboflavin biosynthesis protein [Nocardia sp. RB56]|uniref:Riboflavin biosynthesis protein n=1 Tax=Nocardia aurantia TaxID=2585199 RepID=A0A7K0DQ37_9NOCA|nr:Riboflavin biosynthesis protein [Nocardia aurantia]